MKMTIEYSYDTDYVCPYRATTMYYGKRLVGVSKKGFEGAERDLLEAIVEAAKIQPPEPKEIEI